MTPEPRAALSVRWSRLLAGVLALSGGLASVRPFRESDLFWHLALGRAVLRAHARVVPEPYALDAFSRTAVVPEWLWDVVIYGLFRAFSYVGIALLVVAVAAGIGAVVPWMLRAHLPADERDDGDAFAALVCVAPLVLALALARVRERPESLALLLLAVAIGLSARVFASGDRASRAAVALVGVEVLWAQTHPTFVIAPAVFAAVALGQPLAALRARARLWGATFLALVAGVFTSAHGFGVIANSLAHAHGDAVAHIADMAAPTIKTFDPTTSVFGPLYAFLWLLGIAGALWSRRVRATALLLALVGLALVTTAVRGLGPGGLLLGPFALDGARALTGSASRMRATLLVCALLGLLGFLRAAVRLDEQNGPTGRIGLLPSYHPLGSAARLAAGPDVRVYTPFDVGAVVGFFGDGKARVTMDSRVPLFFDDTESAIIRAAHRDKASLELALTRYAIDVAVVPRDSAECPLLASDARWEPVLVEPRHTLFARAGTPWAGGRLSTLSPCGGEYLALSACVQGATFEAEVAGLPDRVFAGFVRAARAVRCGGADVASIAKLVPSSWDAQGYAWPRDELLARLFVLSGKLEPALDTLEPWIATRPQQVVAVVAPFVTGGGAGLRAFLQRAVVAMADVVPPDVHADLAWLWALDGDWERARFHASLAAVGGATSAGRVLCKVAQNHRDPKARTDARAWLDTRKRLGVESFDCPP